MDMLCNKCSEPWDWFYIRDDVLEDEEQYQQMKSKGGFVNDAMQGDTNQLLPGMPYTTIVEKAEEAQWQFSPGPTIAQCPACIGKDIEPDDNAKIRTELACLYGDDIDGFMADMEDFGLTE